MVSGTYAWFLVGGFAELFDLGFDVIEASGGIELQGSAGHAYAGSEEGSAQVEWGAYLQRDCFAAGELIAEDGKYAPVSSANGSAFTKVGLEGGYFASLDPQVGVDYNELRIKIRSTTTESVDARMNIALTGRDGDNAAVEAARVSVTYNGNTTIFAAPGDATSAVTSEDFPMATVMDSNNNSIIDSGETQGVVDLTAQSVIELAQSAADANKFEATMELPQVSGNTSSNEIIIRVWIEGNDTDCTGEKLSAKHLSASITFGSSAENGGTETP
jgi:hypothetical protein